MSKIKINGGNKLNMHKLDENTCLNFVLRHFYSYFRKKLQKIAIFRPFFTNTFCKLGRFLRDCKKLINQFRRT